MKIKCLLLPVIGLTCLSIYSFAVADDQQGWWATVEGGKAFSINTSTTNVKSMPDVNLPDNYISNQASNTWNAGIGFGYQIPLHPVFSQLSGRWFTAYRIGLMYDHYGQQNITGYIQKWQMLNAYTYQYHATSNTLWLNNQVDLIHLARLTPYVELGFGVSRNTAANYQETPALSNDLPRAIGAEFTSHTSNAFAYRAGFGFNFALSNRYPLSLAMAYRFTNRGNVVTGNSPSYSSVGKINSQLKTNDILISLRYNF